MKKPKKLKRIPSDIVPYIIIEGEAIRDANDKMLIVSYAYSKLDLVNWYIELLDANSTKYHVPHSKAHLLDIKEQINTAIFKIMETPIPKPSDTIISVNYPEGYEG